MLSLYLYLSLLCASIVALTHSSTLLQQPLYSKTWLGPSPSWNDPRMVAHASHLIRSHYDLCKRELVPLSLLETNQVEAARQLYAREDLVVLSHGLQEGADGPILNYANIAAQKRWYDEID